MHIKILNYIVLITLSIISFALSVMLFFISADQVVLTPIVNELGEDFVSCSGSCQLTEYKTSNAYATVCSRDFDYKSEGCNGKLLLGRSCSFFNIGLNRNDSGLDVRELSVDTIIPKVFDPIIKNKGRVYRKVSYIVDSSSNITRLLNSDCVDDNENYFPCSPDFSSIFWNYTSAYGVVVNHCEYNGGFGYGLIGNILEYPVTYYISFSYEIDAVCKSLCYKATNEDSLSKFSRLAILPGVVSASVFLLWQFLLLCKSRLKEENLINMI